MRRPLVDPDELSKTYTSLFDSEQILSLYQDLADFMLEISELIPDAFINIYAKLQNKEKLNHYLEEKHKLDILDLVREWTGEFKTEIYNVLNEFSTQILRELKTYFPNYGEIVKDIAKMDKKCWSKHYRDKLMKIKPLKEIELPNMGIISDVQLIHFLKTEKERTLTIAMAYTIRSLIYLDCVWNLKDTRQEMLLVGLEDFIRNYLTRVKEIYLEYISRFCREMIVKKFNDLMDLIEKHEIKLIEEILLVFDYMIPIEWSSKYKERMIDRDYEKLQVKQFVYIKKKFCCFVKLIKDKKNNFKKMFSQREIEIEPQSAKRRNVE